MTIRLALLLVVLALAGIVIQGGPVLAGCTDPAAPAVDWRRCAQDNRSFATADVSDGNLEAANFTRSEMTGLVAARANGRRSKFISAILNGANFTEADLTQADFTRADLTGADFTSATLRGARFFRAILRDANLSGANLDGADLLNADLSGALWTDGKTRCKEGSISRCIP